MSSARKIEQKLRDQFKLEKAWCNYNNLTAAAVAVEAFYTLYYSGDLQDFILHTLAGNWNVVLTIGNSIGLFEKLGDAFVHLVNGQITVESSKQMIVLAIVLDSLRVGMGYYLGVNQLTKVDNVKTGLDLMFNHAGNFVVNGARLTARWALQFTSLSSDVNNNHNQSFKYEDSALNEPAPVISNSRK